MGKGGGVVFGPEPHKYDKKISKKMRQLARRSVLSSKAKNGEIIILEDISISNPSQYTTALGLGIRGGMDLG